MKRGTHRKFGRESIQRKALLRSLATALIEHGKIRTTKAKAKTLKQVADRLVSRAKAPGIHTRRLLGQGLSDASVKKLVTDIAPRFSDRKGGYTRIVPMPRRRSDGAEMALVEFVA